MADERSRGVNLDLSEGRLEIRAQTADVGEALEYIPVEYKGDPVQIGFNAQCCLDFLNTVSTERVSFSLSDNESPALFHPEGDEDYRYIVMPMRLM